MNHLSYRKSDFLRGEKYQRLSEVELLNSSVEARVAVGSGGGARLSNVSPVLVLSTLFWATRGLSFWATKLQDYIFMARWIHESDHKTQLHRSNSGHFSKKFHFFSSAGALITNDINEEISA